ncbi:unnamed protein product [Paramecium primaurelia]|uniref:Uncharacterized protein n=1 Tax=Paramecium primaurelia TaxID=5886 RepID=A0A8S1LXL0_PARPR|nr:unnamed protein product [Paramecium primaurelia]
MLRSAKNQKEQIIKMIQILPQTILQLKDHVKNPLGLINVNLKRIHVLHRVEQVYLIVLIHSQHTKWIRFPLKSIVLGNVWGLKM